MEYQSIGLKNQIQREIQQYLSSTVRVNDSYDFSQFKLVKRIGMFESRTFPTGKIDSQGNYKFFYDIIGPRIDNEVKNIDFDTKDINIYSPRKGDTLASVIANLALHNFLKTTGKAEEINSSIEEGAGWGNIVWKKVKNTYERVDLRNFYVINQTAYCLRETPVIERHQFSQTDLRSMKDWKNVEDVIKGCSSETYQQTVESVQKDTTVPYYAIYERNGEICLADLKKEKGQECLPKDYNEYVWAKVIAAGSKGSAGGVNIDYIMFAEVMPGKTNEDIYKEYHRGAYKGRWWREGLYELLFDCQVRANEIGNQIARGLEYAAKIIFTSPDKLVVQNILTDLKNGDIIKASQFAHVPVRIEGFDQLANDWNRIISLANSIANSQEVTQGANLPSGTPFKLGQMLNLNANKLYDFIREKLAIPLSELFEQWITPALIKDLKTKDILRLTGDSEIMDRLYDLIVKDWYLNNLLEIGPHTQEIANTLMEEKKNELRQRPEIVMEGLKGVFDGFKPNVYIDITGESLNVNVELQTLASFVALEMDPVRRTAMIEEMMRMKGLDVGSMPKTTPEMMAAAQAKTAPAPAGPLPASA